MICDGEYIFVRADNADATCWIFLFNNLSFDPQHSSQRMASPPSAQFSFTAPFPALKQRRVSLALPASTPRVPWSFRDDTGIAGPSSAQPSSPTNLPKKVKIRKTEPLDPAAPVPEKKPRKKWSPEETQMLVEGCNRVRSYSPNLPVLELTVAFCVCSMALVTGRLS